MGSVLLARAATDEAMGGRAWHVPSAPPASLYELAAEVLRIGGRPGPPRISIVPAVAVRMLGLFSPRMRAVAQTLYQLSEPFIADDSDTRELLGETHTPLEETLAQMVEAVRTATAQS